MIDFNIFKGGKRHAVTFSYDDGNYEGDTRLIEKLNAHNAKGTFHLNSANYAGATEARLAELRGLYQGHEVAAHTVNHAFLEKIPRTSVINEVFEDRKALERIFGRIVRGMSYPFGMYNEDVMALLHDCGIVYSRTVSSTGRFGMPNDFLAWHPTCHHKAALKCAESFLADLSKNGHMLFYIWGHSSEFNRDNNWELLDELLAKICGLDTVWYATNMEIYEYKTAQRQLVVSADESILYNPTQTEVCVRHGKSLASPMDVVTVRPGETVML